MQSEFVETFRYMRDNAKPVAADLRPNKQIDPRAGYDRDCDALRELRTFCPPSKAHAKRLARHRPEVTRADPPRPTRTLTPSYGFFASQLGKLSQLGAHVIDDGYRAPADKVVVERGVERPLTEEQRALRADQSIAEFHRLSRFMPYPCHGPAYDDWSKRRCEAFRKARQAELDCAYHAK